MKPLDLINKYYSLMLCLQLKLASSYLSEAYHFHILFYNLIFYSGNTKFWFGIIATLLLEWYILHRWNKNEVCSLYVIRIRALYMASFFVEYKFVYLLSSATILLCVYTELSLISAGASWNSIQNEASIHSFCHGYYSYIAFILYIYTYISWC